MVFDKAVFAAVQQRFATNHRHLPGQFAPPLSDQSVIIARAPPKS
jgi:hypothetical protein